jgi:hypothetical protein
MSTTQASKTGKDDVIKLNLYITSLVSPTDKGLTITPTAWKNLYCKEQITIIGLSSITLQI